MDKHNCNHTKRYVFKVILMMLMLIMTMMLITMRVIVIVVRMIRVIMMMLAAWERQPSRSFKI